MSNFTENELAYLQSQRLGRIATVNTAGAPHVVPVSFRYNPELDTIDIGGHNLLASKKVRDITQTGRAAFVVDDVLPPWKPRGLEIRARAELLTEGGKTVNSDFDHALIRLTPTRIIGWGIDTNPFGPPNSRNVKSLTR
jgi:pyridoxamine 5'-phosphate oxidase family protein